MPRFCNTELSADTAKEVHRLSGRLTHRNLQVGVEDGADDESMEHAVAVGAELNDLASSASIRVIVSRGLSTLHRLDR
jgi:hypothetical protein